VELLPLYSNNVRGVNTTGNVRNDLNDAFNRYGVAPACLFSSENLKLRRQAHLVGVDEDDE